MEKSRRFKIATRSESDAVDGAHSAASECHSVVALKQMRQHVLGLCLPTFNAMVSTDWYPHQQGVVLTIL